MAPPKSAIEIQGWEYDWLGTDDSGCIALFTTAGGGYPPAAFLRDTDAHDEAIQAILSRPAPTEAVESPDIPSRLVNTWRLVAERGLYAYDSDPNGGPYQRVAVPAVAIRADALPAEIAEVAIRLRGLRFETHSLVTDDMLREAED